jgi:hypothetical protein
VAGILAGALPAKRAGVVSAGMVPASARRGAERYLRNYHGTASVPMIMIRRVRPAVSIKRARFAEYLRVGRRSVVKPGALRSFSGCRSMIGADGPVGAPPWGFLRGLRTHGATQGG